MIDPLRDGHVNFSDSDDAVPMPEFFNAPDNAETVSGNWGRTMGAEEGLIEQGEETGS